VYVSGFDQAAVMAMCRSAWAALTRVCRLLGQWLLAAFSAAGCWSCGYPIYSSWYATGYSSWYATGAARGPRCGRERLPDPDDEAAVRRYASRGIREAESYLAAACADRTRHHGDSTPS